ncbi:MAG: isoprenylcysteine carboxylmethyltransferase family protein [Chloroflexi bacterium]|nr:isoprenylcysteine carboxylmethyltransferase family protein [Chloroflexota bacterium]
MQQETIFRWLTAVLFFTAAGISIYHRHKAEKEGGALDRSGNTLLVLLRLLSLAVVWPLFAYLMNPAWVGWVRMELPLWLRWTAAAVAASMIPAIYWLFSSIGRNISPSHTTREGHQLVTTGPYRYIRHPLYVFGTLFLLSIAVMSALWWLLVGFGLPLAVLIRRTSLEEEHLVGRFGDEYRAYMARTGRFWPKLG